MIPASHPFDQVVLTVCLLVEALVAAVAVALAFPLIVWQQEGIPSPANF